MFDKNLSVQDVIDRRKEIRSKEAEGSEGKPNELPIPNDSEEVVDTEENTVDEAAKPEENIEEEVNETVENDDADDFAESEDVEGTEESEGIAEEDSGNEDVDMDFYQIGDIEATIDDVKKWKEGYMKQADYTKKTQELATQRKQAEETQQNYTHLMEDGKNKIAELDLLINEMKEDVNFEDLKEYDPAEYLVQKEKLDKREKALNEAKGLISTDDQVYLNQEKTKWFESNPNWIQNNQLTSEYENDMILIDTFLKNKNFNNEDVSNIKSHKVWNMILEMAKGETSNSSAKDKREVLKKRVRKAPVVTKSHNSVKESTGLKRDIEQARARFKKTGSEKDLLYVRKLERQIKK